MIKTVVVTPEYIESFHKRYENRGFEGQVKLALLEAAIDQGKIVVSEDPTRG